VEGAIEKSSELELSEPEPEPQPELSDPELGRVDDEPVEPLDVAA
jgi:hypothetical protein